jgi:hypothetical protein
MIGGCVGNAPAFLGCLEPISDRCARCALARSLRVDAIVLRGLSQFSNNTIIKGELICDR